MCPNPNSEKPGTANSSINVKSLHIKDINPEDGFIITANYTFGGSRSISFSDYASADKLYTHYLSHHRLQRIRSITFYFIQKERLPLVNKKHIFSPLSKRDK